MEFIALDAYRCLVVDENVGFIYRPLLDVGLLKL